MSDIRLWGRKLAGVSVLALALACPLAAVAEDCSCDEGVISIMAAASDSSMTVVDGYPKNVDNLIMDAENGSVVSQFKLGVMYQHGYNVKKDLKKAVKWYTKAAENGDSGAQYNLGMMYHEGEGVPRNMQKAYELLRPAAEDGVVLAQYHLGLMYRDGVGVPQQPRKAVFWLTQSGNDGNAFALYELGVMYRDGIGVACDNDKAYDYFKRASNFNMPEADEALRTLGPVG